MQFDNDRNYVESVCKVLIESRFGPGRFDEFVYRVAGERRQFNYDFLDLMPVGSPAYYPGVVVEGPYDEVQRTESNQRMARTADLAAKHCELFHRSPATFARGPTGLGTTSYTLVPNN